MALLSELSRLPLLLFAILAATNAVARPYLGYIHDSQLYAGQALATLDPDAWKDDLFFEFGSQDRFSLFSSLVAPMVSAIGLDAAFFLVHLASAAAFLAALIRLALRLFPGSPGAVVGLIYVSTTVITYGGHNVFHVFEPFTTPRLPASALTLLGLSLTLERRGGFAALAFAGAMMLHPLMAYPGILLAFSYLVWTRFGGWTLAGATLLAGIGTGAIFAIPNLGARLFGSVDSDWLDTIRWCSSYHFPTTWFLGNWVCACLGIAIAFLAAAINIAAPTAENQPPDDRRRFLVLLGCLGLIGLVGSLIVSLRPFAIPLMGQPYRTLWLTGVLLPIIALGLASHFWQKGDALRRSSAIALLLCVTVTSGALVEFACLFAFVPITYVEASRRRKSDVGGSREGEAPAEPASCERLLQFPAPAASRLGGSLALPRAGSGSTKSPLLPAMAASIIVGACVWGLIRVALFYFAVAPDLSPRVLRSLYEVFISFANFGPGLFLVGGTVLAWLAARSLHSVRWTCGLLAVAAAWQTCVFLSPPFDHWGRRDHRPEQARQVRDFLDRYRGERPLCVYSDLGRLDLVWLEMKANSYIDQGQTAGFVFARPTAIEGIRRARLAGPFEIRQYEALTPFINDVVRGNLQDFHQVRFDDLGPTRADLLRLCADPRLDFIVLWHSAESDFADLAVARLDDVLIFDCRRFRGE